MTLEEQEYAKQQLSIPNIISLIEIIYEGTSHRFCSDFRTAKTYWNGQEWLYLPLVLENYKFSEDNTSAVPSLSLANVAYLYGEVIASLPSLIGGKVYLYQVFENYITETAEEAQSDIYFAKYSFVLSQRLAKTSKKVSYRLDPPGFLVNSFAPSRLILREGYFNMAFPGAGEKWQA